MSTPLHLILLAGGKGLRAGGDSETPKQFRVTGRGALFAVSLREFLKPVVEQKWHLASVTVTVPDAWRGAVEEELAALSVPWQLAGPGESRTASTRSAVVCLLAAEHPAAGDLVAVHDAARPFATVSLLDALAQAALGAGGAIPGVPVPDTVVQVAGERAAYLCRETLLAVQTPQVFRWDLFEPAHNWAHEQGRDFTDDGGLLDAQGHHPAVVPGELGNWKITSAADWQRAAELLG